MVNRISMLVRGFQMMGVENTTTLSTSQEFPPAPGAFATSAILHWDFEENSYWRIPDMATVLDIAKSIAVRGWREARSALRSCVHKDCV